MSNRVAFYKKVFDVTKKWWENALMVNDDQSSIWPTIQTQMNRNNSGSNRDYLNFQTNGGASGYDIYIKINMGSSNRGATVLAYAGPFVRHEQTQRPISGAAFLTAHGDKVCRQHNTPYAYATSLMIHELGHIFGFSSFNELHRANVGVVNGQYVWKGPILLAKAREHYACNNVQGVPLQSMNGRVGAHWNEAMLYNECMTPSAQGTANRFSVFSFALLEDTKWYKPDYSRAEHWTHLKGKGCNFMSIGSDCPNPAQCRQGTSNFVLSNFMAIGLCRKNEQGCPYEAPYDNRNCEVEKGWPAAFKQNLGAYYGDNCAVVKGKFKYKQSNSRWAYNWQASISVYSECSNDSSKYTLTFKNFEYNSQGQKTGNDAYVTCRQQGTEQLNSAWRNGTSTVECHNPQTFCDARFASAGKNGQLCDKSCDAVGRCQNVGLGTNGDGSGDTGSGDDDGSGDDGLRRYWLR